MLTAILTGEVRGRVTGTDGAPISGVAVITPNLFQATTTETGEYRLGTLGLPGGKSAVLVFHKLGSRPVVKVLSEPTSVTDAVLEPARTLDRRISPCPDPHRGGRQIGGQMRLTLPAGVEIGHMHDDDFYVERATYRVGGKSYVLNLWTGPSCCSGRPLKDEDVIAVAQTIRTWKFVASDASRSFGGLDMRGARPDGTHWRWLGPWAGSQIEYEGVPVAVAALFDAIIDSMCIATR